MILPVTVYGHPVLRKVGSAIDNNYEGLQDLIQNMFQTMYNAEGIGLAAPQVGLSIRLFVVDLTPLEDEFPECKDFKKTFINAEIVERSGDPGVEEEGCLSLPGIRENVERPGHIRIKYMDENWVAHDEVYKDWMARVLQHEYDHIDGTLFVDRISPIKRRLIKSKLQAISKGKVNVRYKIKTS